MASQSSNTRSTIDILERAGEVLISGRDALEKKTVFDDIQNRHFINSAMQTLSTMHSLIGPPTKAMITVARKIGRRTKNMCSKYANVCLYSSYATVSPQTRSAIAFAILYEQLADGKDADTVAKFASYEVCKAFPTFVKLLSMMHDAGVTDTDTISMWTGHSVMCDYADACDMNWRAVPADDSVATIDAAMDD